MTQQKLFGTNGIRGLVNKELTPEMAVKVGLAIGTFFGNKKNLLVGHDARTSGAMLSKAVISGLTATGCNVSLAGMVLLTIITVCSKESQNGRRSNNNCVSQPSRIQRN